MRFRRIVWTATVTGLLAMTVVALAACASGVAQTDYDALKQQLSAQEQKAAALQQQLSTKDKEIADLQKKATGDPGVTVLVGAKQVTPPTPAPSPTPPPPGFTPPPPPQPGAAKVVPIYAHIDTVTAGPNESKFNVDPLLSCVKTSMFKRGMHVVWRMELVDTSSGKILQAADIKDAILKLPNGTENKFRYGRHGSTEDAPWFWTTAWDVPPDFPLGVLDYTVTVTTQDGKTVTVKDPLPVSLAARNMDTRLVIVP